ncbi:MAG: dTDP-4-dehydrorhamnose reductase [Bdellovibrionales bacterium]|nr:dTDP-4-dehydrorhamnose reductase [Bdellovibrionales bacterium]
MKLLLIGSTGQIGHETLQAAKQKGFEVLALDRQHYDLTTANGLSLALQQINSTIDAIVDAQAYTAVDDAEKNRDLCFQLNSHAPKELSLAAHRLGVPYFWISTDYIFNGTAGPYSEKDSPHPLNTYGESKARGEAHVLSNHGRVIRTAWVYSERRKNFLLSILKAALERPELRVVHDQIGNPTSATDFASDLIQLIQASLGGDGLKAKEILNLVGRDAVSRHQWAEQIILSAKALGFPIKCETIKAISSQEMPLPATRPLDSRLPREKALELLGHKMATESSLKESTDHVLRRVQQLHSDQG